MMDETKVQIGEDVLLDIGIHSDWYISSIGYDGESVDVALRRKADRNKEWWLADTLQPNLPTEEFVEGMKNLRMEVKQTDCDRYVIVNDEGERAYNCIGCQTDCPWR